MPPISPRQANAPGSHFHLSRLLITIGALYTFWIGVTWLLRWTGMLFSPEQTHYQWLVPLSLLFFVILAGLVTAFFVIHAAGDLRDRHGLRVALLLGSAGIWAGCYLFARMGYKSAFLYTLNTANLIVFSCLLGTWITAPLKRPAELVPLCLVMSLADLFSVAAGPTRKMAEGIREYYETGMQGPPPVVEFLLFKIAVPGMDRMLPVFGVADWVIIAFFTASALRFGFNDNLMGRPIHEMTQSRRFSFYLPVSAAGLFAAVMLAHLLGIFLPALPVVVLFFLGYVLVKYPATRQLTPADWRTTAGVVVVMGALMLVYRFL